jgi:Protein of unknown function (DUF1365)
MRPSCTPQVGSWSGPEDGPPATDGPRARSPSRPSTGPVPSASGSSPPRAPAARPPARDRGGRRDHLGDPSRPIRENLDRYLRSQGIDLAGGPVMMLAHARVPGYVFNPLTVYWCHRADGTLACVVAGAHNTCRHRHAHLLRPDDRGRARAPTVFAPLMMTYILTRGSGQRLTGRRLAATRPQYAEYAARTSGFIPLPPRRPANTDRGMAPGPPVRPGRRLRPPLRARAGRPGPGPGPHAVAAGRRAPRAARLPGPARRPGGPQPARTVTGCPSGISCGSFPDGPGFHAPR